MNPPPQATPLTLDLKPAGRPSAPRAPLPVPKPPRVSTSLLVMARRIAKGKGWERSVAPLALVLCRRLVSFNDPPFRGAQSGVTGLRVSETCDSAKTFPRKPQRVQRRDAVCMSDVLSRLSVCIHVCMYVRVAERIVKTHKIIISIKHVVCSMHVCTYVRVTTGSSLVLGILSHETLFATGRCGISSGFVPWCVGESGWLSVVSSLETARRRE